MEKVIAPAENCGPSGLDRGKGFSIMEELRRGAGPFFRAFCVTLALMGVVLSATCLLYTSGEAITGDIPTFRKTEEDEQREERAVEQLLELLEPAQRKRLTELFEELEEGTTAEARLMTAIDKAEAVLSHNEAPISTWEDHEYQLQRTHGIREAAAASPAMAELRQAILEQTEDKIRKEGCGHV